MNKIPPKKVLEDLAKLEPENFLNKDGKVIGQRLAEATEISQGTISKILNGDRNHQNLKHGTKDKPGTVEKLLGRFAHHGVTLQHIRGEVPIGQQVKEPTPPYAVSSTLDALLRRIHAMTPDEQRLMLGLIENVMLLKDPRKLRRAMEIDSAGARNGAKKTKKST